MGASTGVSEVISLSHLVINDRRPMCQETLTLKVVQKRHCFSMCYLSVCKRHTDTMYIPMDSG